MPCARAPPPPRHMPLCSILPPPHRRSVPPCSEQEKRQNVDGCHSFPADPAKSGASSASGPAPTRRRTSKAASEGPDSGSPPSKANSGTGVCLDAKRLGASTRSTSRGPKSDGAQPRRSSSRTGGLTMKEQCHRRTSNRRHSNDEPSEEAFKFRRGQYFWHTRAAIGQAAARAVAQRVQVAEATLRRRRAPFTPSCRTTSPSPGHRPLFGCLRSQGLCHLCL